MLQIVLCAFAVLIATANSLAAAPLRIAYSAISGAMSRYSRSAMPSVLLQVFTVNASLRPKLVVAMSAHSC
jgi:hypothetical protein